VHYTGLECQVVRDGSDSKTQDDLSEEIRGRTLRGGAGGTAIQLGRGRYVPRRSELAIERLMVSEFTCVNIEMTSTLQFGSYKFKLVRSSHALLSRRVLWLTLIRTDVRRVERPSARSKYDTYGKYGTWCTYVLSYT
jgi:hypothetical protein